MIPREESYRFSLACWIDENDTGNSADEYFADRETLYERAKVILAAGRYRCITASRWNDATGKWGDFDELEP